MIGELCKRVRDVASGNRFPLGDQECQPSEGSQSSYGDDERRQFSAGNKCSVDQTQNQPTDHSDEDC